MREMLEEANQAAHDVTLGAFNYANDIMEKIEKQLQIYYDVVQDGKDEIQNPWTRSIRAKEVVNIHRCRRSKP